MLFNKITMIERFHQTSQQCSKIVTENYSTSFASAIKLLHKDIRADIHNIYGLVRFADEIVDTFHDFDKEALLHDFKRETSHYGACFLYKNKKSLAKFMQDPR